MDVHLEFDEQISGPLEQDENPFANDRADIGCVCAPTFRFLKDDLDLLPVPVPVDIRAKGKPVYFSDVVVQAGCLFGHLMICAGKDGLITSAIPVAAGSVCSIGLRQISLWIFSLK